MRYRILILAGAALCGAGLLGAQQPAPQPPPINPQLEAILTNWEKTMNGISSFVVDCTLTKVDKAWATREVLEGRAQYLKPSKASLEMRGKTKPDAYEKYLMIDSEAYIYDPKNKVIRVHKLPPPRPGQVADEGPLTFLFGMKAEEARRRFELKLLPAPPPTDKYYYYIEVLPRDPQDKAQFSRARLVLMITNFLPRQLWFEEPNGNELTWDFTKLYPNVQVNPNEFRRPTPPAGWQLQPMQIEAPRVIRQQQ